ncbi:MAG: uL15m family ribosomal protein [Candidatus Pacearchaeota archaeon]
MKIKKRRKSSRFRGSQSARRGHKKRTRGLGNQGGKGMSGTGKHSGQKKSLVIKLYGKEYFGKDKTLRRGNVAPKLEVINLFQIEERLESFKNQGKLKGSELDLTGFKILSDGELKTKLSIKASAVSESAKSKIKKSGSTISVPEFKANVKEIEASKNLGALGKAEEKRAEKIEVKEEGEAKK